MAKGFRKCKVCGKEYEYCWTERPSTVFRWQDVACCEEHGAIYLKRVMDARSEKPNDTKEDVQKASVKATVSKVKTDKKPAPRFTTKNTVTDKPAAED